MSLPSVAVKAEAIGDDVTGPPLGLEPPYASPEQFCDDGAENAVEGERIDDGDDSHAQGVEGAETELAQGPAQDLLAISEGHDHVDLWGAGEVLHQARGQLEL